MTDEVKQGKVSPALELNAPPTSENKILSDKQSPEKEPERVTAQEEIEWNRLRGPIQDRVRKLIDERDLYKDKYEDVLGNVPSADMQRVPPPPPTNQESDTFKNPADELPENEKQAVELLRSKGLVTMKDLRTEVNRLSEMTKKERQGLEDNFILENEYNRLESKYAGNKGEPNFDRVEIERHMKETGIFNPEKAYQDLYREELYDLRDKSSQRSGETFSEKPTGMTARQTEPLTIDSLRARLSQPDGVEWWGKNRERLLPMMGQLLANQ